MGRYELVKVIGGGGFAAVWRARTVGPGGFERAVAVKVIRPGRAGQKRFQDMLLDEARLVAQIHHPNVTQIWEVGEDPRSLYFVMELVEGSSLDELRYKAEGAGKLLPLRAVLRVLADVCGGLHVAHELSQNGQPLGLVHRDISPQNILVSHHGIAKLIDFGIAKARERLAGDTTTGFIKGKISYMAPEQGRSEELDRRADIWAIGAVAYDLIEGRPPFDADAELARLAALVGPTPVPPITARIPNAVRAVIECTLQKDPNARYPTALALKEALEEAMIESEIETSASECAELLKPFQSNIQPQGALVDSTAPAETGVPASIERPVSSTIQAQVPTDKIELPLHRRRYWPLFVGTAVLIPIGVWMLQSAQNGAPDVSPAATGSSPSVGVAATQTAQIAPSQAASSPAPSAPQPSASSISTKTVAQPLTAKSPTSGMPSASATVQNPKPASTVQVAASTAPKPTAAPTPRPTSRPPDDDAIE
ncbi:MAG: serine/threonine protein kinase [Polyangiaceae bacterium]|nr:serine/threonine protein kinase [Polyangiaceae bacterium]